MRKILLAFILFLSVILPISPASAAEGEPTVSVKLRNFLGNQTQITLTANGDYKSNDAKVTLKSGQEYQLKMAKPKIKVYQGSTLLGEYTSFSLTPTNTSNTLSINKRPYLGSFLFNLEDTNTKTYIRPTNSVKVEDYLRGVVPQEVYTSWEKEALKAQAVSARTYAIGYGSSVINDTISFQVYGGYEVYASTDAAVKETAGMVLKYNDKLISAVFSSSNGGKTETNTNAWGTDATPYFQVKDDSYDPAPPWSFTLNKKQVDLTGKDLAKPDEWWSNTTENDTAIVKNIKSWLNSNGYVDKDLKIVSISNLDLTDKGSGGRVTKGSITIEFFVKDKKDADGKLVLQKKEFKNANATNIRTIIGNTIMKSYLVDKVTSTTDSFTVAGKGNGHGVGLSQWGAQNRAKAGQTYKDILGFYYPGVSVVKQYDTTATPAPTPAPTPQKDTTAPIIKDIKGTLDAKTSTVKVSFNINEAAKTTVTVRDSKSNLVATLAKEKALKAGTNTLSWNASKSANGTYKISVSAIDNSPNQNKSSAVSYFKLNKPVPKDTKPAIIKDIKGTLDSKKNSVKVSFNINEATKTTVYVKDSKNKVIATLAKEKSLKAGTSYLYWNVSKVSNGTYTFAVSTTDNSKNKSSAAYKYKLSKPAPPKYKTGIVKVDTKLNIRSQPNTSKSSKIVGTVANKQKVTVYSKTGSWYHIKYGKVTGYVYYKYLTSVK